MRKVQIQIIVLHKEAVVKDYRSPNSKDPPWNHVKNCIEVSLVNVSRIMCWIFWVLIVKPRKHQIFTHICTFVSSLTVFGDWTKRKGSTYQVWCFKCFIRWTSAFDGLWKVIICSLIRFLSLQLNEFLELEIKPKLSSVQKIISITAIADQKIISAFCVSRVLCYPPQSAVEIK